MLSITERRFYWMKFQRDFFKSLRIKKLRRLAGGDTYTIIYLKLQLLSIVDEGYLHYKGVFDSIEEELAEDIDEDVENVQVTMSYLLSCGLMEQDGDTYYLPYAAENIGSESASAKRVRDYREKQKTLQCNASVTEMKRLCNAPVTERREEIEKEKDIEKKDTPAKEQKHKHGEYGHVLLKESELSKLVSEYGQAKTDECIKFLDEYIEMKGYKAKSHYLCIRKWVLDAVKERKTPAKPKNSFSNIEQHDIDFDALEKELLNKPIGG